MEFITCIYNGLHDTNFGGSLNRDRHYMFSLKSISAIKEKITCYIGEKDLETCKNYFENSGIENIILKKFDLTNFEHHLNVKKIRENDRQYSDVGWNNRCIEIMWGKIWWMFDHFKDKDDDYKIFWIDAGLSHGGIFPKKYNKIFQLKKNLTYEEAFQFDKIFNTNFVKWIDSFSDNGPFFMETTQPQYPYPDKYKIYKKLDTSIIRGLFGGKKKDMMPILEEFMLISKELINNSELLREEQILTIICNKNPEKFNTIKFNTWYHEDWDCYEKTLVPFSNFVNYY